MTWWNPISAIVDAVGGWAQSREKTQQVRAEANVRTEEAKANRVIARIEADTAVEIARGAAATKMDEHIQDYDLQVLRNRQRSIIDEVMIVGLGFLVLAHFIPYTQPFMREGWGAMGYAAGAPWWFEMVIVIAFVSTLGGMRVLKLFSEGIVKRIRSGG